MPSVDDKPSNMEMLLVPSYGEKLQCSDLSRKLNRCWSLDKNACVLAERDTYQGHFECMTRRPTVKAVAIPQVLYYCEKRITLYIAHNVWYGDFFNSLYVLCDFI